MIGGTTATSAAINYGAPQDSVRFLIGSCFIPHFGGIIDEYDVNDSVHITYTHSKRFMYICIWMAWCTHVSIDCFQSTEFTKVPTRSYCYGDLGKFHSCTCTTQIILYDVEYCREVIRINTLFILAILTFRTSDQIIYYFVAWASFGHSCVPLGQFSCLSLAFNLLNLEAHLHCFSRDSSFDKSL